MTITLKPELAMELAVERATSWFAIHADQRLKLMNFYLILLGAILAGFVTALEKQLLWLALLLSLVLLVITYCFKQLDRRTAQLIKAAEAALLKIEHAISETVAFDEIKLTLAAENKNGVPSYRRTFNKLFWTGAVLGIVGCLYSATSILGIK